jgi:hypothetical protein
VIFYNFLQVLNAATSHYNDTLQLEFLKRNKRFLTFPPSTGTSIMKYVTGFLGPIDIPLWQNINCLRNFQYQYSLPANWATKFPTWPGFSRSLDNNEKMDDIKPIKPDSSRKIAYELIEDILNRYYK